MILLNQDILVIKAKSFVMFCNSVVEVCEFEGFNVRKKI